MWQSILVVGCVGLALTGCTDEGAIEEWNRRWIINPAVEQGKQAQVVVALTGLGADVDLKQLPDQVAVAMKASIEAELPCAAITVSSNRLDIEYGANAGNCSLHGMTLQGKHSMLIVSSPEGVEITHNWLGLGNGHVTLSGSGSASQIFMGGARTLEFTMNVPAGDGTTFEPSVAKWSIKPSVDEPGRPQTPAAAPATKGLARLH